MICRKQEENMSGVGVLVFRGRIVHDTHLVSNKWSWNWYSICSDCDFKESRKPEDGVLGA